ncbi:MAG: minor capsid protein [Clostridia bacterium]|nr:minor capsid protein [Clostridia bacterium]
MSKYRHRPDYGHILTEKKITDLEPRIRKIYQDASEDMTDKINDYFASFAKRDAAQLDLVNDGKLSMQDYTQWRLAQIGRGRRMEALRDQLAERMTDANEVAASYINDETPGIYSLNRNYAAYTIEQVAGDVGYTLWDESTVRRLIVDQPGLMPYYPAERAVDRGIDLAWGKQQITRQVTSGILQGESVGKIANRLQKNIPDMNRTSAVRAARTAMTAAQNGGRMDSYRQAAAMGIKLEREWVATLDNRTRHAHAMLDGQCAPIDKPFKVDGEEIMFPGDDSAAPHLVYNCRCTLVAALDDVDTSDAKRRAIDPVTGESVLIENMTYREWEAWKKAENPDAWDTFMKKGKNYSADKKQYDEYKAILGENMPKTFEQFQELKYNNPEGWKSVKTLKKQTVFVNNAPCVTTPQKYTGYFLKPGAKHSAEFFDVGYTEDNPMQLRYDMAKLFNIENAIDASTNSRGEEKFSIFMQLGVTRKKTFRTVWQKDTPASMPRIITAHREDDKS